MTIYLAIRSDAAHGRSIPLNTLVTLLAHQPGLQGTGHGLFNVIRDHKPRATLEAFACSAAGNYAVRQGAPPPKHVNLLELRYPYNESAHSAWYESLAAEVARSLGWEAWGQDDDGREVCLWRPASPDADTLRT
ncbi:hypothetical protein [Diaphorobacter caeni]|uniref:hypothetical protein n=1 Tax=Diaphorobacter caeni TaxID=2784387 RepID=UPI00188F5DAB|nr:hypothetical protein [Diaphorobacter caeni]MBF5003033.1 hypothetical protein [Diaphorobacter caeni]